MNGPVSKHVSCIHMQHLNLKNTYIYTQAAYECLGDALLPESLGEASKHLDRQSFACMERLLY